MEPGDFVFYETHSVSGWIIKYIQRKLWGKYWYTNITHVAFCVGSPDIVKEAVIPRVVCRSSNIRKKREIIAVARPNYIRDNPKLLEEVLLQQKNYVGLVYGIPQIIGHLIQAVLLSLGFHVRKNPIRMGRDCVEDAYYANQDLCRAFNMPNGLAKINASSLFPSLLFVLLAKSCNCTPLRVKRG